MSVRSLSKNEEQEISDSTSYISFINGLRSPATKKGYRNSLKRYMNHLKVTNTDDLLIHQSNPRLIEKQIIEYVIFLRKNNIAYATIAFLVAPVFTFYQLNDVLLNRKKVFRYLGEIKRAVRDKAYSIEQIQIALQNADQRMRMILLILSCTGARIGALPSLKLGDLTKVPEYEFYKMVFYESTNNEYYSFTTREASKTGIDSYLLYRQRCGEKITFNQNTNKWEPEDAPLIRLQFDMNDVLQARNPKPITLDGLRIALNSHMVKSGIRQIDPLIENKRVRKSIGLAIGFRKRVISTFIEAGLNHEIRELLVDHATHLDQNYFRPSDDQVLQEYLKAEPLLTIDPALRLQHENKSLREENREIHRALSKIDKLYDELGIPR